MTMPAGFPYREVFLKGMPQHQKFDAFWRKHPPMKQGRWAKIFAPFDALAGFDEAIGSKEISYEPKRSLSESEKEKLNKQLNHLHALTYNGAAVRKNRPIATVTYFVPCTDVNNFAYGTEGQYNMVTGLVRRVDQNTIVIDSQAIPLEDISEIWSGADAERKDPGTQFI
jgi:hypothetical protein